jgi:hypothetical protein
MRGGRDANDALLVVVEEVDRFMPQSAIYT